VSRVDPRTHLMFRAERSVDRYRYSPLCSGYWYNYGGVAWSRARYPQITCFECMVNEQFFPSDRLEPGRLRPDAEPKGEA